MAQDGEDDVPGGMLNSERQLHALFAVPFVTATLAGAGTLNPVLRELFLRREGEGAHWRNPQPSMNIVPGLFESRWDVFAWPEPCVQQLQDFCLGTLLRVVAELNQYSLDDMRRLELQNHCWFHVTRRGACFNAHNHAMASWSGVYCVDPGRHDADQPLSGALHFQNPHQHANMFLDPGNDRLPADYAFTGRNMLLSGGQLVLFPSWLFHEVRAFHGEGERITVAFNCWFRPRSAVHTQAPYQPLPPG